jgi:CRP-like cAMP-binding protein
VGADMLASVQQAAQLLAFFQTRGVPRQFGKDDYIIAPHQAPPGVFYLVSGLVKAYDMTRYGEENLLIIRKEHELFPLIWALTGQERHIIYRSLTPATTLLVDHNSFLDFIHHSPDALAPLLDITVEMYRLHSERIITLEYRTVRERVVSFLLTMAQRFGGPTEYGSGVRIEVTLRHQDIASSISASRETTSRELAYLERRGMISKDGPRIVLRSIERLEAQLRKATPEQPTSS